MEQTFPNDIGSSRTGATANSSGPASPFAMVVWLRGDEPYCSDFHLGAEEVMEQLGIKRSRLTQISGQELRVGRLRQGRYIRPVFRQVDVDEYKTWVRPTASHVKSKDVVEQARQRLESTLEDMTSVLQQVAPRLETPLSRLEQRLSTEITKTTQRLESRLDFRAQQTERSLRAHLQEMTLAWQEGLGQQTESTENTSRQVLETLADTNASLQSLAIIASHLDQRYATLAGRVQAHQKTLIEWQQQMMTDATTPPAKPKRGPSRRTRFRSDLIQDSVATKFKPRRKPRRK